MLASALAPYRRIFTPATALFSLTGLVARLPISMVGLGIVLLAEHETGSYAFAGAVSATALIASAVFAVPQGRLLDRLGQARVLPLLITVWGVGLAAHDAVADGGVAGLVDVRPRRRRRRRAPFGRRLRRGRAGRTASRTTRPGCTRRSRFEAVADEAVFLLGPIIVTMLATAVHPVAGLSAALGVRAGRHLRLRRPPLHRAAGAPGTRRGHRNDRRCRGSRSVRSPC